MLEGIFVGVIATHSFRFQTKLVERIYLNVYICTYACVYACMCVCMCSLSVDEHLCHIEYIWTFVGLTYEYGKLHTHTHTLYLPTVNGGTRLRRERWQHKI